MQDDSIIGVQPLPPSDPTPKRDIQDTEEYLKLQKQQSPPSSSSASSVPTQSGSHNSSTSYRPDIDGLRTIAVGIVVIFHAWPEKFTGGFIGVDIFFVISGYLITQILVKENKKGTFSYFNFYNRRVKRIYPALIVVLLFVLYLGFRYSEKQHFEMLTKTMAASTIFGANIEILTYKQGYFDASVKTNPLLHLWSLGVQQQFYIFWPFLISLLLTKFRSRSFYLLCGYTVLSFVLNIIAVYISDKFDFYFPFCRFWQMAIGGLLAFKAVKLSNQLFIHALSIVGLATILVASFFLSEANLYPGWWALFPTMASAAIIQSGPDSMVNKHILSNKLMVFFGKISYSLYLWHWPLLVFSRILYPEGSDSMLSKPEVIVLISVGMSMASYFFVENPLRFKKEKAVFFGLLLVMVMIGVGSAMMHVKADQIKREDNFDEQTLQNDQVVEPEEETEQSNTKNQSQLPLTPSIQNITEPTKPLQPNQSLPQPQPQPNQSLPVPQPQPQPQPTPQLPKQSQKPKKPRTPKQKFQYDMIPTQQDYYVKNGKKIPNFSKNRNRVPPTVQKIRLSSQNNNWFDTIFDKKIDKSSKYYREKLPTNTMNYQIANEGQPNLVLLVGDSHSHYTAFRFQKLYAQAKLSNNLHKMPTLISIIFTGTTLIPYEDNYKFVVDFIEEFRPVRILFVYYWASYSIYHGFQEFQKYKSDLRDQFFYQNIGYFLDVVRNSTKLGIEVTTTTFQPYGPKYNPFTMFDPNGIIPKNIQPQPLSTFTKNYHQLASHLQSQVKKAGGNVISYSDHLCYEDMCEVVTPTGYSIFYDTNHWNFWAARDWLTVVDFFVEF